MGVRLVPHGAQLYPSTRRHARGRWNPPVDGDVRVVRQQLLPGPRRDHHEGGLPGERGSDHSVRIARVLERVLARLPSRRSTKKSDLNTVTDCSDTGLVSSTARYEGGSRATLNEL